MLEKFRNVEGGFRAKNWVAYAIFGAIIVVFALFGVNPDRYGSETGGVAAVVNDSAISLSEYRNTVERIEQDARIQFNRFPESQRAALQKEMQRRALEDLINMEIFYQAARQRGVIASDVEVRDRILDLQFLKENGRFQKERYQMWLAQIGMSPEDFERIVRRQIVNQKLQELFMGSAAPTREELKRSRQLANQKVNLRFIEIGKPELAKLGSISTSEVEEFLKARKNEVEKFYKDNTIEFAQPEKVQARHILIKVDDKRSEAQAVELVGKISKELNAANFAQLAGKYSDDPGSKNKGGDLGQFERGRMVPEFEEIAFKMEPNKVSAPVKTSFGFHFIMVEKKFPAKTESLESVQGEIARKFLAREKEGAILAALREKVGRGRAELDKTFGVAGLKWSETGEFDLSSENIPKLGESADVIRAVVKNGKRPGLIPELLPLKGDRHLVAEVIAWKAAPEINTGGEGLQQMVANKKSVDLIETFAEDVKAKANIQRNPRIVR